jgi:hypothetical protein
MSRLDVMKSLVRSAASGATRVGRVWADTPLRKRLVEIVQRRLMVPDSLLTAAVARVPGVSAVTVSASRGELRVDATFHDGTNLLVHFIPVAVAFAPRGAKEWSLRAEPMNAAYDVRCADIVVALATEVARRLWGPFLRGQRARERRSAFAHRDGDVLVVDLRTIPEVRSALTQPLLAAAIEAFSLRAIEVMEGGLQLIPGVPGFDS